VAASPVGVNVRIIEEGVNGYLCQSRQEWRNALEKLLSNAQLRQSMGVAGRKKIEANYCVTSNGSNFLSLFQ
jgi:glycosyltransferase involved in cell wall biosynthesis